MKTIGVLHPGKMGVSIANAAKSAGHTVLWLSAGRSPASRARAEEIALVDTGDLATLCERSEVVISVCPPDQAAAQAELVAAQSFTGVYVDCNAVSAATSQKVAQIIQRGGASYVDGGIIGPPAWQGGSTRLYLSGQNSTEVAEIFAGSLLDARTIGDRIGAASALKMAYAGWTKGSAALLMTMFAMAKEQEVEDSLLEEWSLSQHGLAEKLNGAVVGNASKAWRFVGEMEEIANSLEHSGLPREWFDAAADIYGRQVAFKDTDKINPDDVIDKIIVPD